MTTLRNLIAETYTADESKFFVLCDAGNGSAFGEAGRTMDYDTDAAKRYAAIELHPTTIHRTDDGNECSYASDWINGDNGYRYQVRF